MYWFLPMGDRIDSTTSATDSAGVAQTAWLTPSKAGRYHLIVRAGERSATGYAHVDAGRPLRPEGVPDSIRFTRVSQSRHFALRMFDAYGNQATNLRAYLSIEPVGPFTAGFVSADSISLGNSNQADAGSASLRLDPRFDPTRRILAVVKLVSDPVVASVRIDGGVDSVAGIGVGESVPVRVIVADSGGRELKIVNLSAFGVQFASSDSTVASISTNGVILGLRAGSALITARYASSLYSVSFSVVPAAASSAAVRVTSTSRATLRASAVMP